MLHFTFETAPPTFFYMDLPYWETAVYGVVFPFDDYRAMAQAFKALKVEAMLSINDHPAIRECFAGFLMEGLDIPKYGRLRREDSRAQGAGNLVLGHWG